MFSIVIVTHNRLSLLKRAVESALNQSLACEIVIADDASTDGTEDYVKSLGDRVVYYRNAKPSGQSATVNAGVLRARGEWIKLLDDDDYLDERCLAEFAKAIALRPEAVICSCRSTNVNPEGEVLGETPRVSFYPVCYVKQEDIHYAMLIEMLPFGTTTQVAFRRDCFLKTGGWNAKFDGYGNDIDCWVEVAQFGDAIAVNKLLTYRTMWEGNYSEKYLLKKRLENNIAIKQKMFKLMHPKHHQNLSINAETIKSFLELYWGINGITKGKVRDGAQILYPAFLSPGAWQYFWQYLWRRKIKKLNASHLYHALKSPEPCDIGARSPQF
jgi:glycosyltransferase involved in cell wall biosynthesis